jgi:hypothetical protein
MSEFTEALENFRAASEEIILAHFDRNGFTFAVPGVTIGKGRKYIKLWNTEAFDGGEARVNRIHAFVEVSTGDIFKPASTKAPAKHKRGNIYENAGRDSMTPCGHIAYLR